MTDPAVSVDSYMAMWNEMDATRRLEHIRRAWSETGRYEDPVRECQGYAALSEMVANVHAQFPGYSLRRASGIDLHHDQLRFAWELVAPDGAVTVSGVDVCLLAADGRLQCVVGFFGRLPEEGGNSD